MGLRFSRRITVFPGVRLNFSRSGVSTSIGPRGASLTIGPRGTYANVSLHGTGISYRQRLDGKPARPKAPPAERNPAEIAYQQGLLGLLAGRSREPINGDERAGKRRGQGFALPVLSSDREVWGDVLQCALADEDLPFPFHFDLNIDGRSGRIQIFVELPDETVVPMRVTRYGRNGSPILRKLPRKIVQALYEDICSALVLRVIYETYRILPDADVVEVVGRRAAGDAPARPLVLLEITCGRWSFSRADLDQVDPSDLLESLGGVSALGSEPVVPLETLGETPTAHPSGAAVVLGSYAEQEELKRLQAELGEQETILLQNELELATLRAETHSFHLRYMERVGSRYAELDRLNARIAEIRARLHPEDLQAPAEAQAAERQAEESAQASAKAERETRSHRPAFVASEALKKLFREVAKRTHPDLATDLADRESRTARMAEANRLYQAGDEEKLRQILGECQAFERDSGAAKTRVERTRLLQAVRNVRERIRALAEELAALRASELYSLMVTIAKEETGGSDPLADLAREANFHIRQAENRLRDLNDQARAT